MDRRKTLGPQGRTFVLCMGFLGAVFAGWWLGLLVAFVTGVVPLDPPRFPGEYLAAMLLAYFLLALLTAHVHRVDGNGRGTALGLLFLSSFATLDLLCSLYLLTPLEVLCVVPSPQDVEGSIGPGVGLATSQETLPECRPVAPLLYSPRFAMAMVPTVLIAVLLCSGSVRRGALLQFTGFTVGGLFVLAGLLSTLARTLAAVSS